MLYSTELQNITVSTQYHRMYQEQQKICTLHGCATDYCCVFSENQLSMYVHNSSWTTQNIMCWAIYSFILLSPYLQSTTFVLLDVDTGIQMQWPQGLLLPSKPQHVQSVCCLDSHTWGRLPVLDWSSHRSNQMLQQGNTNRIIVVKFCKTKKVTINRIWVWVA
jgi:hypothetical protein